MRNYQKQIALFFMAVTGVAFLTFAQPQKAEASIGFETICQLAGGGIPGLLDGLLGDGVSAAINKAEGWIQDKLPDWAKGIFGAAKASNPVPTKDIPMNAEEKMKNCAQTILTKYANTYARNFINKTLSKYKIANYAVYTLNLANQVYVAHQIKDKSLADQFLIKENINRILKRTASSVDLSAIYKKRSLTAVNFQAARTANIFKDSTLATLDDPLVSTPQGQAYLSRAAAADVLATAQQAANLQVLSGQGNKDQLEKKNGSLQVKNPAALVNNAVNAKVSNLNQQDLKPQDKSSIIGEYAIKYIENKNNPGTDVGQLDSQLNDTGGDLENDIQSGFDTSGDTSGLFDSSGDFTGQ